MSKNYISDLEHAYLILIKEEKLQSYGHVELDTLYAMGLIQLIPNTARFMLTIKGEEILQSNKIKKEYLSIGKPDYNNVLNMMSDNEVNALICAAMNERIFDKIPTATARVLGQHMLDTKFYHKFGLVLISKMILHFNESLKFFEKFKNKNEKS